MIDKRTVCIEIIGAVQEWAEEHGVETSAATECEAALYIYAAILPFLKGAE